MKRERKINIKKLIMIKDAVLRIECILLQKNQVYAEMYAEMYAELYAEMYAKMYAEMYSKPVSK